MLTGRAQKLRADKWNLGCHFWREKKHKEALPNLTKELIYLFLFSFLSLKFFAIVELILEFMWLIPYNYFFHNLELETPRKGAKEEISISQKEICKRLEQFSDCSKCAKNYNFPLLKKENIKEKIATINLESYIDVHSEIVNIIRIYIFWLKQLGKQFSCLSLYFFDTIYRIFDITNIHITYWPYSPYLNCR